MLNKHDGDTYLHEKIYNFGVNLAIFDNFYAINY